MECSVLSAMNGSRAGSAGPPPAPAGAEPSGPGGALVLPAAARYRNIKLALPVRHAEGQLALDLFGSGGNGSDPGGDGDG